MVAAATTSSESASRRSARRLANDSSSSPTYYVYMTPNIMAGVLFGFLFIFISIIGFSCMNDLEGQTVFVSKVRSHAGCRTRLLCPTPRLPVSKDMNAPSLAAASRRRKGGLGA